MIATHQTKPSAAAATYSVVPDDTSPDLLDSAAARPERRSSLRDVLSAWIFCLLLFTALGAATLILDVIR